MAANGTVLGGVPARSAWVQRRRMLTRPSGRLRKGLDDEGESLESEGDSAKRRRLDAESESVGLV